MYSAIQSCICILVTDPDHGRDGLGMFPHDKRRAGAKLCGHLEGQTSIPLHSTGCSGIAARFLYDPITQLVESNEFEWFTAQ
jgi:hypothetical protein